MLVQEKILFFKGLFIHIVHDIVSSIVFEKQFQVKGYLFKIGS